MATCPSFRQRFRANARDPQSGLEAAFGKIERQARRDSYRISRPNERSIRLANREAAAAVVIHNMNDRRPQELTVEIEVKNRGDCPTIRSLVEGWLRGV